jgi:hypothetical protein
MTLNYPWDEFKVITIAHSWLQDTGLNGINNAHVKLMSAAILVDPWRTLEGHNQILFVPAHNTK